jgi:hypothetical protein
MQRTETKTEQKENTTEIEKADAFVKFDEWDEEQIVQELQGKIIEDYFYSFDQSNSKIVGLSYTGTRYLAAQLMKQGFPLDVDCNVEDAGDSFRAKARAVNVTTKQAYPGFAEQAKLFPSGKKNPFAFVQAASKAERNAIRKHIDEKIVTQAYKEWLEAKEGGKSSKSPKPIKNITPPAEKKTEDVMGPPFDLSIFSWFTHDIGKSGGRSWKQGDSWGFANVTFGDNNLVEKAMPIVAAIESSGGALTQDGELISFEEKRGQLMRRKLDS